MMKEKPTDKIREIPPKLLRASASREALRAKLNQAGVLVMDLELPADLVLVSDDELEQLGEMRPGARPSEELVAEDRGR